MKNFPCSPLLCVICFISAAIPARSQSVPAETGSPVYNGFQMPTVGGTLHYAVSAGLREVIGYSKNVGNITDGTISANVGFITPSVRMPTSVTYTGGFLGTTGPQPSSFFHDFDISQVYDTRKLKITLSDQVRYLPDTPASGVFGVFGTGTSTGTVTPQGTLIPYATRIENSTDGSVSYQLTGKTSVDGDGMYAIERFPGYSGGIQTNVYSFGGSANHRISPLQQVALSYHYSNFSYVYVSGSFSSQGATGLYRRQINRRFLISLAGGPQYISASTLTKRPASFNYNADVSATYMGSLEHALAITAAYKRSTNGGSGLTFGATNDTFTGSVSARFTRSLSVSALGTYARSSGLQLITANQINTQSAVGSVQANRAITRTLSVFVSYTALHQAVQGIYTSAAPSPLIGLQQVLGFGVTYSPSPVRLGR